MQRHTEGLVGKLWRINDPTTIRIGDCFLNGRIRKGDLFLCTEHAGDCFQNYVYIKEYDNCLKPEFDYSFGSYGIGDATELGSIGNLVDTLMKGDTFYLSKDTESISELPYYEQLAVNSIKESLKLIEEGDYNNEKHWIHINKKAIAVCCKLLKV